VAALNSSLGTMIETHELTKHFTSKKATVKAVDGIDLTVATARATASAAVTS
jgi:ABC-type oligopeptide transport system ATPase subunit